ncbi:hypothetical protein MMC13_000628 [Lambiella insularis]|nr:hypothetical protein [Lambiella insularis]
MTVVAESCESCTYDAYPFQNATECEPTTSTDGGRTGPGRTPHDLNTHSPQYLALAIGNELPVDVSSALELQARRIEELESKLAGLDAAAAKQASNEDVHEAALADSSKPPSGLSRTSIKYSLHERTSHENMLIRGKGFKTQFYGASFPISLIAHFSELKTFMRDVTTSESLARLQRELSNLERRRRFRIRDNTTHDIKGLLTLLPSRQVVDRHVKLYFESMENIYHILFAPDLWTEYDGFWQNPPNGRPEFVVILFLLMAIVYCASEQATSGYAEGRPTARETAVKWIEVSETWFREQTPKSLKVFFYQIQCLIFLAKQANSVERKKSWTAAGSLLRHGMAAGLHREPSLLGEKTSGIDKELRRRLWATMVELELQASIDRGMQASLTGYSVDRIVPMNIDDEEIGDHFQDFSEPRPGQRYTPSAFLTICQDSLKLRQEIVFLINNPSNNLRYEDVLLLEGKVIQKLETLPCWTKYDDHGGSILPPSFLPQVLLDIQLRQFLIILHSPFTYVSGTRSKYSRTASFEAAASILSHHSKLVKSGNLMLLMLRNDVFRAAISVCHNMFRAGFDTNDLFLQSMRLSFSQLLEEAIAMLEAKVLRYGKEDISYWFIAAAYALVQSKNSSEETSTYVQSARDRIAKLYRNVLCLQEMPSREPIVYSGTGSVTSLEIAQSLDSFDYFDVAGYDFDEIWPFGPFEL